ncbi:MAG: SDR family NAD(P)-dependent oxidoreductase [Candidatus Latescibacterota bacterium]|nr:MAG: SDR family NAD(P)-dependent oxidoreductase [Candidatus Latescibacterota bacterium]
MNRVKGKRILVTGASSGIGEGCAKLFASGGADLVLVARREGRLRRLKETLEREHGIDVRVFQLDVRDRDAVEDFGRTLEREIVAPDVLVNNAGLASGMGKFFEGDFDDWDRMIDTNVKGLLNVSRYVVPLMVKQNRGHIVNIGSIAGHIVYPGGNVYNATKYAVRALNQAMSLDLVGTNIRVSCIDPGATQTEFSVVRFHGDEEKAEDVYRGFKPLTGDDIAEAIYFVVNAPEHVNVLNLVIMPTAQRSPFVLHREED